MTKLIDLTGKRFGKIKVLYKTNPISEKYNRVSWECICDCGTSLVIEGRNLTGAKYQQQSCGCIREKMQLLKTCKIKGLTIDFLEKFNDFKKYLFLHKQFTITFGASSDLIIYKNFIEKFYVDKNFNLIYNKWNKNNPYNTFYNWAKPSLDHIIPKSRGGLNSIENVQFLTVFENLAKRDMTMQEWQNFKKHTNTNSDLFI